jgi:cation:H+ antiporter
MGWSHSFVGTQFVAAVTSLPEVTVTLAALRMGAIDMAIANLLGSNLFNIAILAVDDVFYLQGPLLADVSPVHSVTALSAIAMSAVVVIGLLTRPRERIGGVVSWPSLALVVIYLINSFALY